MSFRELVCEIEAEHPGGAACVDLSRFAVHCLNLRLTAIIIRIYRIVIEGVRERDGNECVGYLSEGKKRQGRGEVE